LLRNYVAGGGRLVVDESDGDGSLRRLADQDASALPVRRLRTHTVAGTWGWQAPADPLTSGIDLSEFADPSYAESGRWDVQAAGVQRWARPVLSSAGSVVVAAGGIGRGESIWSGIGLPYHAASFGSSVEAALIGRLLDARDPVAAPDAEARFVNSQRREITVGADARGVLFKEHFAGGWHAETGGQDLRIASAGPGMMYVALPPDHGRVTVVLSYRTGVVEKLGWAVSLLALIGVLVPIARRPRWWRRGDANP
jgi:hypothetical protein